MQRRSIVTKYESNRIGMGCSLQVVHRRRPAVPGATLTTLPIRSEWPAHKQRPKRPDPEPPSSVPPPSPPVPSPTTPTCTARSPSSPRLPPTRPQKTVSTRPHTPGPIEDRLTLSTTRPSEEGTRSTGKFAQPVTRSTESRGETWSVSRTRWTR